MLVLIYKNNLDHLLIGVVVYKKVSPGLYVRDLLFYGNYFFIPLLLLTAVPLPDRLI